MSVPVIAFFNSTAGTGTTSLVYHLAWMFSDLGVKTLVADFDPQAALTAAFFDEDDLEGTAQEVSIFRSVRLQLETAANYFAFVDIENLTLVPCEPALATFDEELSEEWLVPANGGEYQFRILSAFWRVIRSAAETNESQVVLMDLGPNLGSINRAALISADYVVIPLAPDLFSLQGLRNVGPALHKWRREWIARVDRKPGIDIVLPEGQMQPIGYVLHQHSVRLDLPVKAYDWWINRIPSEYRTYVLSENEPSDTLVRNHSHCLARLKHYRNLMSIAQEARKPMFHLKPADGAIGAHLQSAQEAYRDFEALARTIAARIGFSIAT